MSPDNEKVFRLFIRVMAAAGALLAFGLTIALLERLGLNGNDTGRWLEFIILFLAVFTGGTLARPAGDKLKKAIDAFVDNEEET